MAVAPQTGNFLLNLLKGVVTPFRKGAAIGARASVPLYQGATGRKITPEQEQAILALQQATLSPEETTELNTGLKENPALTVAKPLVGAAALGVGGGSTALGRVGSSALSGAMSGFGSSRKGEEITSSLGGAAIGTAFGVGFEGLRGIGQKLLAARAAKTPTVSGTALASEPGFTKKLAEAKNVAKEIGIRDSMPSMGKVKAIDTAFSKYQDDIMARLKGADPIDENTLLQKLDDNFNNSNIDESMPQTKRLITQALNKLDDAVGDNVKLNELKSFARNEMGNFFSKGGSAPTQKQEVWGMVYNTIKDSLDTVSPDIRVLNNKQRVLFDLADEFVGAAKASTDQLGIRVPFTDATIPTGASKEAVSQAAGNVGKVITAPITGARKALELGSQVQVPQMLKNVLAAGVIQPGQEAAPVQTPQDTQTTPDISGSPDEVLSQLTSMGVDPAVASEFAAGLQQAAPEQTDTSVTGMPKITAEMAALGQIVLNPDDAKKLKEAYSIQEAAAKEGAGGKGSPQAETALRILTSLKDIYGDVQGQGLTAQSPGLGRILGSVKGNYNALTQDSSEAANYKDSTGAFVSLLTRGLGQSGVLTEQDIKLAKDAIPKFSDTPEKAAQSWATIEDILRKAAKKEIELTKQSSAGDSGDVLGAATTEPSKLIAQLESTPPSSKGKEPSAVAKMTISDFLSKAMGAITPQAYAADSPLGALVESPGEAPPQQPQAPAPVAQKSLTATPKQQTAIAGNIPLGADPTTVQELERDFFGFFESAIGMIPTKENKEIKEQSRKNAESIYSEYDVGGYLNQLFGANKAKGTLSRPFPVLGEKSYDSFINGMLSMRTARPDLYEKFIDSYSDRLPMQTLIDIENQTPAPVKVSEWLRERQKQVAAVPEQVGDSTYRVLPKPLQDIINFGSGKKKFVRKDLDAFNKIDSSSRGGM